MLAPRFRILFPCEGYISPYYLENFNLATWQKGALFPTFFFFFSWLKCKIDPLHFTFCHVSTLTLVSVNSVFKFQKCFNSGLPLTSVNAQPLGVWIHVCYVLRFCVFLSSFFFTPFPPTGSTDHVQYMNSSHNF